jgi:hypothetical protein
MRDQRPQRAAGLLAACSLTVAACPQTASGQPTAPPVGRIRKPQIADTIRVNVYADNWFILYVNGELVAVDSIAFIPHNVVSVDILPKYPMTIAVMARDNADPKTGMEYANTTIGDGGFVLTFGDGTVTNGSWKARCFSRGPIGGDRQNPRIENDPLPEDLVRRRLRRQRLGPRKGILRVGDRPQAGALHRPRPGRRQAAA